MDTIIQLRNPTVAQQVRESGLFPAGWYDCEERGSHEYSYQSMRLISLNKDEDREDMPSFTYWYDETPMTDNYRMSRFDD